jgi:hypothetical protein
MIAKILKLQTKKKNLKNNQRGSTHYLQGNVNSHCVRFLTETKEEEVLGSNLSWGMDKAV